MLTFLLAFSFECFGSPDRTAVYFTAAGWIAVAPLVGWTIITGWEGGETSSWTRMRDHVRAFLSRENDDDGGVDITVDGGASATASEKESLRRWWARIRQHSHLPFAQPLYTLLGLLAATSSLGPA